MRRLRVSGSGSRLPAFILLCVIVLIMPACVRENVEKPELNGKGPLAIKMEEGIPAPESHIPADLWRKNHMVGLDNKEECMGCHNPETSCNNCHKYVGVKLVEG